MWARSLGIGFLIGFLLSFLGVAAAASQLAEVPPSQSARLQPALVDGTNKAQLLPAAPRAARHCRWPALI